MNPDLEEERNNATINSRSISTILFGGEPALKRREFIINFVKNTKDFDEPKHTAFMIREERIENGARKARAMIQHANHLNRDDVEEMFYYRQLIFPHEASPIHLHNVMFVQTLQNQCNENQKKKWLLPALVYEIIGTYAQTELGHGTNLRKLETTATYDVEKQEFVINSPTITSAKWWPGNLGKSVNCAIVIAQLIIKNRNYGVQSFFVQLRDLEDHRPLQGIIVGDIGPKFGLNSNDNGFLRFDNFRIPRENMLMKFSKVEPDGTFVPPAHGKLAYGTMIYVRSMMVAEKGLELAKAATIAVRYSCVRHQGERFEGRGEVKLLDYQTQQYRLFPELAKVFAVYFAGMHLRERYTKITHQIQQGDTNLLPELHFLSAGLKAYVTFEVARGIEICRLSCGGHGYSHASGLPELYTFSVGACTHEGDNIVLLLQVARHLLKTVQEKKRNNFTDYLWKTDGVGKSPIDKHLTLKDLLNAYEHVAQRKIIESVKGVNDKLNQGLTMEKAWGESTVTLSKCAKSHVRVFIVRNFIESLNKITDPKLKTLFQNFCQLYALCGIYTKSGAFQEDGYITSQQMSYIQQRIFEILEEVRPNAVAIVDSFMFTDRQLNSVLGRFDGNVYPNLYKFAVESPLNKTDNRLKRNCKHYIRKSSYLTQNKISVSHNQTMSYYVYWFFSYKNEFYRYFQAVFLCVLALFLLFKYFSKHENIGFVKSLNDRSNQMQANTISSFQTFSEITAEFD